MADELSLLKKSLNEGKVVKGSDEVLKLLRQGKIKKIYLASNAPEKVVEDINNLTKLNKVVVVKLKKPSDELGVFCKKPFSIAVLGVR